jgi:fructose-bisphosphate aldolase class II
VTSSSVINCVLEAAAKTKNPVIIQISQGGAAFYAGKSLKDDANAASVAGSVAAAMHVRIMAKYYGVPVIMHSDHCAKKLEPWFEGMIEANENYFASHGEPLFSSHMLDFSEETDEENIGACVKWFTRMAPMGIFLEMEIGITGGVEDGVDNSGVANDKLYTTSKQVYNVHKALSPISPNFSIAAAFGNVHGVYKAENVHLQPAMLAGHQAYTAAMLAGKTAEEADAASKAAEAAKLSDEKPLFLVFHGGSGSQPEDISVAVANGVVKMNIDTDTQWAYWEGARNYEAKNHDRLQDKLGWTNPETGKLEPNKSFYDPRKFLRECEKSMCKRVEQAYTDLNCKEQLGADFEAPKPVDVKASAVPAEGSKGWFGWFM